MLTLFTIPNASTVIASTTDYSSTFFTEFLPVIYVMVGLLVAALAIRWLTRSVKGGVKGVLGGKRGGKRRR